MEERIQFLKEGVRKKLGPALMPVSGAARGRVGKAEKGYWREVERSYFDGEMKRGWGSRR